MYSSTHLSCFDLALFALGSLLYCAKCEEDKWFYKGRRRPRPIPVVRPRIWLYQDFDYLDTEAIDIVRTADLSVKPNAVIVVGTTLKVDSAKILAQDIYHKACQDSRFTT